MEESRALSPEISGLYNKVQSQAADYGKAFDMLEKSRKEFNASIVKLNELEANVRRDSELAISQINTNVLQSLIILKNRTEDTVRLTIDLGDIKTFKGQMNTLKDDLVALQSKLSRLAEDMDSTLRYFKKKSEVELESTLLTIKNKIDKDIQNEGQKIDIRSNLRFKQFEGIFVSFDERIKTIEDSANSAIKRISLDVDILKHNYNTENGYVGESNGKSKGTDLQGRVNALELISKGLQDQLDNMSLTKIAVPQNVSDKRIEDNLKKLADLEAKFKRIENNQEAGKSSVAGVLAGLAILISIIAIALKFI